MKRLPSDIDRLEVRFDERLEVRFDEGSLVADAGLLVAAALMSRLGLEQVVDDTVRLGDRVGGARRVGRCCRWWRRCWRAVLILIMLIGCGPVPPTGCWGFG